MLCVGSILLYAEVINMFFTILLFGMAMSNLAFHSLDTQADWCRAGDDLDFRCLRSHCILACSESTYQKQRRDRINTEYFILFTIMVLRMSIVQWRKIQSG
jgi:hypothetical protein